MIYVPGEFIRELELIKKSKGINKNAVAFGEIISDLKLARNVQSKASSRIKDLLGFDI